MAGRQAGGWVGGEGRGAAGRRGGGGQPESGVARRGEPLALSLFKGPSCWLLAAVCLLLRDRHKWVMGFMHVRVCGASPPPSFPLQILLTMVLVFYFVLVLDAFLFFSRSAGSEWHGGGWGGGLPFHRDGWVHQEGEGQGLRVTFSRAVRYDFFFNISIFFGFWLLLFFFN